MSLNVIDLFCGCGGLSLGFTQAGFCVIDAFDSWDMAIKCYNLNFDHTATKLDLSNIQDVVEKLEDKEFSLIIGGPPCQDFSSAGSRREEKKAALTRSFAEIVSHCKPNYFLMENVDLAKKSSNYISARKLFIEAGYGLTELSLDTSYFNVPQRRRRFIVIGALKEKHGFLEKSILDKKKSDSMTVREKFPEFEIDYYYRHPRSYSRRGVFSIDEPSPTIRGVNRPMPENYVFHQGDRSKDRNIRALTYQERAQIQTFPNEYIWPDISKHDLDQLIGNAVPVKFAEMLALVIKEHIELKGQE